MPGGSGYSTPPPVSGPAFITGLATDATTGGHFTDQYGRPRLWAATETWALPVNAGNWGSPSYQHDYDTFFANRAAQGFTVMMTDPVWAEPTSTNTSYAGNDWDGTTPLAGGSTNPSTAALNPTFWARIDYMLTSAASHGITIGYVLYDTDGVDNSGTLQNTWTTTQWTDWATKIGTRYKGIQNLIWLVGNDAFSPFSDSQWDAIKAGLVAAGDTHPIGVWYNAECTSRYVTDTATAEPWGTSHSAFNFTYSYNAGYWIIEYAYGEVANEGAASLLPVIVGDGFFYNGTSGLPYDDFEDRAQRQEWWWTLASGTRGILAESEEVYPWTSSSAAAVTGDWFFANNAASIISAYTSWTGWHTLIPDTGNALVTAGRGTRVSGLASGGGAVQYEPAFTNNYVAASKTPDGKLALCYLPLATTITVNTALLAGGWAASWVDPVTGAATSAGGGPTFNSTAKGSNSEGNPDWVLVFQAP